MTKRALVVPLLLAFACGNPAAPPAAPTPQPAAGPWPPRIAWPDRIALKVVHEREHTAADAAHSPETQTYLLAFERLDPTHMRFWEAGAFGPPDELFQRFMTEVAAYPSLRLGPRYNNYEHGGFAEFQKAALASRALQSDAPEAAALRHHYGLPGTDAWVYEETLLEWWLIVGAWDLPLQVAERVEADSEQMMADTLAKLGPGARVERPEHRSFESRLGGDDKDWTFVAKGVEDGPTRVRLTGTWTGKLSTVLFGSHFQETARVEVDADQARCTLTVEVIADRATLVPISMTQTWEVRYVGADGREHVARRTGRSTYEEVDWSLVAWKPL